MNEVYNKCLIFIEDTMLSLGGQCLEYYSLPQPVRREEVIPHLISSNHVFYADDCKLYANPILNYRELQTDLNTVYRWCLDWLIPLNTQAT